MSVGAHARAGRRPAERTIGALVALCVVSVLAFQFVLQATSVLGSGGNAVVPQPAVEAEHTTGFVRSEDAALTVGGQPWHAVGFNDYRMTAIPGGYACDAEAGPISGEELGERLDRIRAAGGTVVRTWFFQSIWDPDGDGLGDFAAFDRVIDAAVARGLRVIPVLTNHWADCEAGGSTKDHGFYSGGYVHAESGSSLSYVEYAALLADYYSAEPGIALWELANEPEAPLPDGRCEEASARNALVAFGWAGADAIRAADPNHLISLGAIGSGQCGTAGTDYLTAQGAMDICSLHIYDEVPQDAAIELPGDAINGVAARIEQCTEAGKPIVAGELGLEADLDALGNPTGSVTTQTLGNRAAFLDARVEAMRALGLDGFLVWQLEDGPPRAGSEDPYGVGPCDPVSSVLLAHAGDRATAGPSDPMPEATGTQCGEAGAA